MQSEVVGNGATDADAPQFPQFMKFDLDIAASVTVIVGQGFTAPMREAAAKSANPDVREANELYPEGTLENDEAFTLAILRTTC